MRKPTDRENEIFNEYLEHLAEVSLGFCKRFEDEIGVDAMVDLTTAGIMYFAVASFMASNFTEANIHENVNDIWSELTSRGFLK